MPSPKLTSALKKFANKISGTSHIDNGNDPNTPAFKLKNAKKSPASNFVNKMTPNQKTYGVPGAL